MFKPSLKRSRQDLNLESTPKLYPELLKPYHPTQSSITRQQPNQIRELPHLQHSIPMSILPRKMLEENPLGFYQPKEKLTAPLSSQFYEYPESIKNELAKNDSDMSQRGIGHYDQLFWFFRNQQLLLWHYLPDPSLGSSHAANRTSYKRATKIAEWKFDSPVFGVTAGRLKNVSNMFEKDEIFLVAVAFSSLILLYHVQDLYNLSMQFLEISIRTESSLTGQKMLISENNELFFGGSTRLLTMMSFKQPDNLKKVIPLSFTQKFTRILSLKTKNTSETIEQIISTKDRVYCLIRKNVKREWWLSQKFKNLFTGRKYPPSQRVIDVYSLGEDNSMKFLQSLEENEIAYKVRNSFAEFSRGKLFGNNSGKSQMHDESPSNAKFERQAFNIKGIFIDKKTGSLGVTVQCGYFIIIKDTENIGFWKEPYQIPRIPQQVGLDITYSAKKDSKAIMNSDLYNYEVLCSKGYGNLTLLKNMVVYVDDQRFYILKCRQKTGDIWEVNNPSEVNFRSKFPIMEPHKKWIIFQKSGFEVITKPEPRDVILAYISSTEIEKEEIARNRSMTSKPYLINMKIQELAHQYGYSEFCTYLLELLMLRNYEVRLNRQFQEFIKIDIIEKGQRIKYEEWYTLDSYREGHEDRLYEITPEVQTSLWRYLMEYQYYQIRLSPQIVEQRGQSHTQTNNAMWFAMRFMVYKCLENILHWTPIRFTTFKETTKLAISRLYRLREILLLRDEKMMNSGGEEGLFYRNQNRELSEMISEGDSYVQNRVKDHLNATEYMKNSSFNSTTVTESSRSSDSQLQQILPIGLTGQLFTTTSTLKLSELIIEAIPKMLQLIQVYQFLGEVEKSDAPLSNRQKINTAYSGYEDYSKSKKSLPKFIEVLFNNPSRKIIKETVLKFMVGPSSKKSILEKIQQEVPELQIGLDLSYLNWKENYMMKVHPEDVDLAKLAIIITSTKYLSQLKIYFKDCPDRYLSLLIQKIKAFRRQDYELRRRGEIYNDGNYFEREEKKLFDQNRYALELEIMNYEGLIKHFLDQVISSEKVRIQPYQKTSKALYSTSSVDSESQDRQKRKVMLQKVIKLVATECRDHLKENCQYLLRSKNLFDYVVYLKASQPAKEYMDDEPYLETIRKNNRQKNNKTHEEFRYFDGRGGRKMHHREKRLEEMSTVEAAEFLKRKEKIEKYGGSLFLDFIEQEANQQSRLTQKEKKPKDESNKQGQLNKNSAMDEEDYIDQNQSKILQQNGSAFKNEELFEFKDKGAF